jgi:ribosomal protein S27AE
MGLPIFETMDRAFYGKVEAITFTQQTKETMATHTKRRLEERKCRLPETVIIDNKPDDQMIWQNFRSVRKTTTALGQVRFDAAHDDKFGHADFFWAKCLAESAAQQQDSQTLGLLNYYKTGQAQRDLENMDKIQAATPAPKAMIPAEAPVCPECASKLVIAVGGGQLHCNQCGIQWWPKDAKRSPVPVASRKAYLEGR